MDLLRGTAGETIGEDDDGCSDSVAVYIGGDESWDVSKSSIGHGEEIGQDLGSGKWDWKGNWSSWKTTSLFKKKFYFCKSKQTYPFVTLE